MKKVLITLLVLTSLGLSAFAEGNDRLFVTSEVPVIKPSFNIYGGLSSDSFTATGSEHLSHDGSDVVGLGTDVSKADSMVYVRIAQVGVARISGSIVLSVTATPLENTNPAFISNNVTGNPTVTPISGPITENSNGYTVSYASSDSSIDYTVIYYGTKVANGSEIGKFLYTWPRFEDAALGDYQATITLTYTIDI